MAHDERLHELAAQGLTTMHARLLGIASGEVDADDALALVSVLVGSQMLARAKGRAARTQAASLPFIEAIPRGSGKS